MRGCAVALAGALALWAGGTLAAEGLADPTRPPPAWLSGEAGAQAQGDGTRRVQTVVVPSRGKPRAVIGGQAVAQGEMLGEARVVRITEKEVVLEGASGREVLKVVPEAEKTPAARRAK